MKVRNKDINTRIFRLIIILFFLTVVVLGRLVQLQIIDGKALAERLEGQLKRTQEMQSPRGTIYDRNGRELAISVTRESLYVDPQDVMDNDKITPQAAAAIIGQLAEVDPEVILKKVQKGGRFSWVKHHLEPETVKQIRESIKANQIRGFAFQEESKRFYPNGKMAAQVLGCVGKEDNGLLGIEYQLDSLLKGTKMSDAIEKDGKGRPIAESVYSEEFANNGKNVYLTIDSNIQFIVESAMDEAMLRNRTTKGAAIVVDPTTGEILAMVSRPTFDPNDFSEVKHDEFLNRGISYIYEPGSTFKSVVAAIAFEEKLVRPDEYFYDNGTIEVSGRTMKNWDGKANGSVSFTEIIKKSLNTGFVQVGLRIGAQRLMDYAKVFGFGSRTGIELPGEEYGLLFKSAKNMVNSDIASMAIGQSIAATPLQLIMAVSSLANEGVLLEPRLIREIRNEDGSVYETHTEKVVVRQTISAETAHLMQNVLEKVVSEGGGARAQVPGYRIAGKTGTAQKLNSHGTGYEKGAYIASFVGFAPADKPRIAVIVMIDNPSGESYYGGAVAAPVAGKIMGEVMRYLNVLPQTEVSAELPRNARQLPQDMPQTSVKTGSVTVPDVRGKTMKEAMRLLSAAGLTMVPEGTGIAVRQSIEPYIGVKAGTELRVWFEPR